MEIAMTFRIGINMAGAISAGAYTAGALDFLIQALDEWYSTKEKKDVSVPMHGVSIEVLSGASAGGMCAAIGAAALHDQFPPVEQMNPPPTAGLNKLYRSWVQDIDIENLLETQDLDGESDVVSILDSTGLDKIAANALTLAAPLRRQYVSESLTLILTLTNLRGIPYSLDKANQGSFEENIGYYADQIQFEILQTGQRLKSPLSKPLFILGDWSLLQKSALATGAFPVILAPRVLSRDTSDYTDKLWVVSKDADQPVHGVCQCEQSVKIPPALDRRPAPASIETVNVDGGATNNNPFECARRFLAGLAPAPSNGRNIRDPLKADRAVITIAPFPGKEAFDLNYKAIKARKLLSVIGSLLDALLAQSRFQGESLSLLKSDDVFSRFVIAPSDDMFPARPALMSSSLGAFGGFLAEVFRDRDYQLGRRNCQWFLREHFVLPVENPLIASGLTGNEASLIKTFQASNAPSLNRPPVTQTWMPIIPLCGRAAVTVNNPGRFTITRSAVDQIADKAANRLRVVLDALIRDSAWSFRVSVSAASWLFKEKLKSAIKDFIIAGLGDAVQQ